jgi:AraC family transcriptional regulator
VRPSALAAGTYYGRPESARISGALGLCRTLYTPGQRIPAHAHDAAYLCLAVAGAFRELSGRTETDVVPGSAVLHRAGETHADRFGDAPASCLNVSFPAAWFERLGIWLGAPGPALYATPGAVGALVWRLAREFDQPDEASELAIEGLTMELLASFLRVERRADGRVPRWMPAVVERLRQDERVSLAGLAHTAGIHPATLARGFRRCQGCSPGEYRRRWRIARACAALRASDAPLAEIAARTGFADQRHLARALREAVGQSPAAYRRAARSH